MVSAYTIEAGMTYADDTYLPQVTSGDACRAAGITPGTLKNWLSRKPAVILLAEAEKVDAGSRTYFKFSLQSVYHLALVAELTTFGLLPRRAHEIASAFTLFGGDCGEREPAQLFGEDGTFTYLVADAAPGGRAEVQRVGFKRTAMDLLLSMGSEARPLCVLNLTKTVWRVRAALDLPKGGESRAESNRG